MVLLPRFDRAAGDVGDRRGTRADANDHPVTVLAVVRGPRRLRPGGRPGPGLRATSESPPENRPCGPGGSPGVGGHHLHLQGRGRSGPSQARLSLFERGRGHRHVGNQIKGLGLDLRVFRVTVSLHHLGLVALPLWAAVTGLRVRRILQRLAADTSRGGLTVTSAGRPHPAAFTSTWSLKARCSRR